MLVRAIELVASAFKRRRVSLDRTIPVSDLIECTLDHSIYLLRGLFRLRPGVAFGKSVKLRGKSLLSMAKGTVIGSYCTIDAIGKTGIKIGGSSSIGAFSIVKVSGSLASIGNGIDIGSNVGIGDFSHIGGAGGVSIGDDTIAGAYLSIHPENHNFSDPLVPIRLQGVSHKGIVVGKNCWIGAKVTILDGARIGDGCVVAAGAVVTGEFPENSVVAGVPARLIKQRY